MGKRLYVGNLPYDTDDARLTEAFSQDGLKVDRVHIVTDRETGRPRGFAFVEMATEQDAEAAIEALDGYELGGRRLRVSVAEERRPASGSGPERRPEAARSEKVPFAGRGDPPRRRKKEGVGEQGERNRGGRRRRGEEDDWEAGKRGRRHDWDDDEEW